MLDLNKWLEKQICKSKITYKNPYININEVPTRNKNVREIKLISCMKKMHSSDKQNNTDDNKDYKSKSKSKSKNKTNNKSNMNNMMNNRGNMSKTSKMIKMIKMIKMNSLETKTSEMKQNNLKCFWEAKYHKIKFIKSCKKRNTVKQNFERAAYINSTTSDLKDSVSNLEEMMKRFNSKYINETIKEKILESSNSIRKNKLNLKLKLFNEIVKNLYLKPNSNFNFNFNFNPNLKSNPNPNANSTNFNSNVNSNWNLNSNSNSNSNSKYTSEKVMCNKSSYANLMNYFKSNKSFKDLKIFNSIKSLNRLHLFKEKKLNSINPINSINTINSLNVLNPEYHSNQVIYENIFKNQTKNIPINLFTPSNESQRYSYDGSKNYINNINNVNHMNQNCIFENTINGSNRNFTVNKNGQNGKYPVIE